MRRFLGIALLVLSSAACGSDGGTAPPANVDLTGTWSVTTSPIQGQLVQCQIIDLSVQVVHSGTALTGTYSATDMVCNGHHTGPGTGQIVNGTDVNGSLHFHFATEDFDLHGTVRSTDTASGTYTVVVDVGGTLHTVTGTWTAHRQ
jgi:hypothetical protein